MVEKTAELGDIRIGLFLLRESGNAAENKSSRKIKTEHVETAIKKLDSFKIRSSKDLGEEENFILNLVKEKPERSLTQIYEDYSKAFNKSYRTLQRKIKDLEEAGLITVKEEKTKQGKTTNVNIASKKLTDF